MHPETLLDSHADVSARCTQDCRTALYLAAEKGRTKIVQSKGRTKIVQCHADVNAKSDCEDFTEQTPAAEVRHSEIVKLLLDHQVDVNARCKNGRISQLRMLSRGRTLRQCS